MGKPDYSVRQIVEIQLDDDKVEDLSPEDAIPHLIRLVRMLAKEIDKLREAR